MTAFDATHHESVVREFRAGDRAHIDRTPARVLRLSAEAAAATCDAHKEQESLVRHQAALKRRHLPIREFVRAAPDVLLAIKPCWAMSPLVVSQLLPAERLFDVVVFDEASQIGPADGIAAILRGSQLVVAGDDQQLPPSAFFLSGDADDDESDDVGDLGDVLAGTRGFESILDALAPLLPSHMLEWHYRSQDERLIAFSNAHFYNGRLTTFAGVGGDEVLRYVPVAHDPSADTNSPDPEVEAVVQLILDHARERPNESLGVIAMGMKHARRIEDRLHRRLSGDPELAGQLEGFFDERHEERFFVKNLETVQGDERDAIILSVGYGKEPGGELPLRFGPLLTDGGERRLNVAVTRARRRTILVSSFSHRDIDPSRSESQGLEVLREYLRYVESGGASVEQDLAPKAALDPFERDVQATLTAHGLELTAQLGYCGDRIDFAVSDPRRPDRFVLALECDGVGYRSARSRARPRPAAARAARATRLGLSSDLVDGVAL